jgi:hypothetical protein
VVPNFFRTLVAAEMPIRMNIYLALFAALVVALFSIVMWYGFVRYVPQLSGSAIITSKTFQPAHTVKRFQGGARRESWTQEEFRVPDGYVFQLNVDGLQAPVYYSCDARAAATYEVGQKVRVQYEERGFPLMSKRIRVIGMARADAL